MTSDVRWKQRFKNLQLAMSQFSEFMAEQNLNKLERQGLIQCFEYTFELAWKTFKDYLEQGGQTVQSPRAAIQIAFNAGFIKNGHDWIDALEKRNILAHSYNEEYARLAEELIKSKYYPMLLDACSYFENLP